MGLTKSEWKKWRKEYTSTYLSEKEVTEIDRHFNFKTR